MGPYSLTETTYKRIHKNKDGTVNGNWEIITPEWGERTDHGNQSFDVSLSKDGDRLFISDGADNGMHIHPDCGGRWTSYTRHKYDDIWSTTDGINWQLDNKANFKKSHEYNHDNAFNYYDKDRPRYATPITPKALEPAWAKTSQGFYYKMDNVTSGGIPLPLDDIRKTADRGQTNFIIKDEHKNTYNNFLISKTHPDKADTDDWENVKIHNYTKSSMHWMSSPNIYLSLAKKL